MKPLLIVESPSKASTISKYLKGAYEVKSTIGHIKELPEKRLSVDIENDFAIEEEVIEDKKKLVNELKKISKTAPEVIIATDSDREGEAIAAHIASEMDKSKISRVIFTEITKEGVEAGLNDRKEIDEDLVKAATTRRIVDRLFGYKVSPVLWSTLQKNMKFVQGRLSAGRVQSSALKIIIERDLSLLEETNCRYHISQISSKKSLDLIAFKKNIVNFTTGVSINNLALNENDIGEFKTFLKLSPPLRTEDDRISLIEGINKNLIDVIVSDHKPEDEESKRLTFSQAATGASGIETFLSLALEQFHNGSLKLEKIVELITHNPAKILKINKGNLSVGTDADFCIVDINKPWVVKKENLLSKSKNTSIEGRKLQGKVISTFVNGQELYKLK